MLQKSDYCLKKLFLRKGIEEKGEKIDNFKSNEKFSLKIDVTGTSKKIDFKGECTLLESTSCIISCTQVYGCRWCDTPFFNSSENLCKNICISNQ